MPILYEIMTSFESCGSVGMSRDMLGEEKGIDSMPNVKKNGRIVSADERRNSCAAVCVANSRGDADGLNALGTRPGLQRCT